MLFIKLDQLFTKRKKEALIFLQFIKKYDYSLIFRHSLFTIHFFGSLFTIHYKKGHYSLIIIPHPDP